MSPTNVTIKDVFEIADRMEGKLDKQRAELLEMIKENTKQITALRYWKANIMGKITMAVAVISFGINFAWDYIRSKFDR